MRDTLELLTSDLAKHVIGLAFSMRDALRLPPVMITQHRILPKQHETESLNDVHLLETDCTQN